MPEHLRPPLLDAEAEAVLAEAESALFAVCRAQGMSDLEAVAFVWCLAQPGWREHVQTVVELTPTRLPPQPG